eukprot:TRINITY_DN12062_c1_g5_i1.p1 TRINITY_DN12062_c1_g5~~TRINITY_DN12062_c1_g5_i1.p1  ORF type:complete len:412 (+),score=122.70 TRINITY_DN12062_c1_g5_i1:87-1322(+)
MSQGPLAQMGPPPGELGGVGGEGAAVADTVPVSYLTSSQYYGAVLHFFQTVENAAMRIDNVHKQKRIFAIVDLDDNGGDLHRGVARCVSISKFQEVTLPEDELRVLLGPFTEFDVICQGSSMLDFIRTIGALYSPQAQGNQMALLRLDEGPQQQRAARCRLFRGALAPPRPGPPPGAARSPSRSAARPPPPSAADPRAAGSDAPWPRPASPPPASDPADWSPGNSGGGRQPQQQQPVNEALRLRCLELGRQLDAQARSQQLTELALKREILQVRSELERVQGPAGYPDPARSESGGCRFARWGQFGEAAPGGAQWPAARDPPTPRGGSALPAEAPPQGWQGAGAAPGAGRLPGADAAWGMLQSPLRPAAAAGPPPHPDSPGLRTLSPYKSSARRELPRGPPPGPPAWGPVH